MEFLQVELTVLVEQTFVCLKQMVPTASKASITADSNAQWGNTVMLPLLATAQAVPLENGTSRQMRLVSFQTKIATNALLVSLLEPVAVQSAKTASKVHFKVVQASPHAMNARMDLPIQPIDRPRVMLALLESINQKMVAQNATTAPKEHFKMNLARPCVKI